MSVVTIAQYRIVTGDEATASALVQTRLDGAEDMLEDYLGRKFAFGEYTEYLRVWPAGLVYPAAVPVASVAASAGYEVFDTQALVGVDALAEPFIRWEDYEGTFLGERIGTDYEALFDRAYVTYEGGWTSDTMPYRLQNYICKLAKALDPALNERPAGSRLVRVGDVQVSYDKAFIDGIIDQFLPGAGRGLKGYRLGRL